MSAKRGCVRVSGIDLDYTLDGTGIPLLVVGSSIYYPRTFSPHLRQFCSIACVDLPHFVELGPGFDTEMISLDLYARCIEAARADAGLGRIVAVGHSHHGNVALEYARRHPDQVSQVVLIGSPPVNNESTVVGAEQYWSSHATAGRKAILEARRRTFLAEGSTASAVAPFEAFVAQYVADAPLYWHDPNYDASWLWEGMRFGMDAIEAFRGLFETYDLSASWPLEVPVLIVMGRDDFAVPHTLWQEVLPGVPNATFHVLDESGHTPQIEEPEKFDELLLTWLGNTSE